MQTFLRIDILFSDFNEQIAEIHPNVRIHKDLFIVSGVIISREDRHDEANSAFVNFSF
jgi:hypothetical protein